MGSILSSCFKPLVDGFCAPLEGGGSTSMRISGVSSVCSYFDISSRDLCVLSGVVGERITGSL